MNRDPSVAGAGSKEGVNSRDHPKLCLLALCALSANTSTTWDQVRLLWGSRSDPTRQAVPQPAAVTSFPSLDPEPTPGPFKGVTQVHRMRGKFSDEGGGKTLPHGHEITVSGQRIHKQPRAPE